MTLKAATACLFLAVWLASGATAATIEAQPSYMRHIPFSQAPRPVRLGLLETLASCGIPAKRVRSVAAFDVGPIGGLGRKDYFFESGPGIGDGRESICTANYTWQMLWMSIGRGRYKALTQANNIIYISSTRSIIFDVNSESNCGVPGATSWSDDGRFWEWNPKAAALRPITRCMLLKDAQAWAKARGYQEAESY
jgi:hypothetical protein